MVPITTVTAAEMASSIGWKIMLISPLTTGASTFATASKRHWYQAQRASMSRRPRRAEAKDGGQRHDRDDHHGHAHDDLEHLRAFGPHRGALGSPGGPHQLDGRGVDQRRNGFVDDESAQPGHRLLEPGHAHLGVR